MTNVYQLGAVFYQLFTGRPPFEGQSFEIMNKIQNEQPIPPSKVADVPEELDEVLLTALATDKDDRYDTFCVSVMRSRTFADDVVRRATVPILVED
jgi:serine/threonine protein kinase